MARRVSWTNNSSGHLGTYVYRAPTLDPQNLPAPVATVDPVAQGVTAEWVDNEVLSPGDYDYAVQDFDGQGVGALSSVTTHTIAEDYASAQIGDEIGGGIYAGIITYADSRQFHIVAAKAADQSGSRIRFGAQATAIGVSENDDGVANCNAFIALGGTWDAINFCYNTEAGGNTDWYCGAFNENQVVNTNLILAGHPEFSNMINVSQYFWSSTEVSASRSYNRINNNDQGSTNSWGSKTDSSAAQVVPIRRIEI